MAELDDLFAEEKQALDYADNELNNPIYKDNPLLPSYGLLLNQYRKLLRQMIKLFKISDSQQRSLQKVQQDIRNLLDNAGQGFLTFGNDLLVDKEYSAECIRIFNDKIDGRNIVELVFAELDEQEQKTITNDLLAFWPKTGTGKKSDKKSNSKKLNLLPGRATLNDRFYRLEYHAFKVTHEISSEDIIMMIITDVTDVHQAEKQVNYLSYHDKLTGLYNRAYIDMALAELDKQDSLPTSIIIADVNGLKITNDVFGHWEGDRLLVNIANVLRKCLRGNDLVARWGGDEFLVVLPGANEEMARVISERIRTACLVAPKEPIRLSIALGMATRRSLDESFTEVFSRAEDQMYRLKRQESTQVRSNILHSILKKMWANSPETEEHINRMQRMALLMAGLLDLSTQQTQELEQLALMHDVGKVALPVDVLSKPGPLEQSEWEIVKKHSEIGYRLCSSISEHRTADHILGHHEHWDGTGYPQGLKGEEIPLLSRVIGIIDAYDVMTHDSPYKKALSPEQAAEELRCLSGTQFDPNLVTVFLSGIDSLR